MNKKGILSTWTPEREAYYQRLIDSAQGFAERYMITNLQNFLKYDGRSRESKKAMAKIHLMFAMASDEELTELDALQKAQLGEEGYREVVEAVGSVWQFRDKLRATGIPRKLLED